MARIPVTRAISIDADLLEERFVRASGPGGQHVNTTSSAVELRFDMAASDLPEAVKARLAVLAGSRLSGAGVIVLRAEGERSQAMNRQEVRDRLIELIREATIVRKKRRPTKPSKAAKARRVDGKTARSAIKAGRRKVTE